MSPPKGCNPNHPKPGAIIRVEPIRDVRAIGRIKKLLADHPRNHALFVLGMRAFSVKLFNPPRLTETEVWQRAAQTLVCVLKRL